MRYYYDPIITKDANSPVSFVYDPLFCTNCWMLFHGLDKITLRKLNMALTEETSIKKKYFAILDSLVRL